MEHFAVATFPSPSNLVRTEPPARQSHVAALRKPRETAVGEEEMIFVHEKKCSSSPATSEAVTRRSACPSEA